MNPTMADDVVVVGVALVSYVLDQWYTDRFDIYVRILKP